MKNLLLFLSLFALTFSSCIPNQAGYLEAADQRTQAQEYKKEQDAQRQVVFTADMDMVVENPDSTARTLQKMVAKEGGQTFFRQGNEFTFKIHPEKLEPVMDQIALLGEVKSRVINSSDITSAYYDTQIRLENAEKTRQRYLQILDMAQTVDEILKVEKELERINRQIDLLRGQMNLFKNQVADATLKVSLREKTKLGVIGHLGNGVVKGVKWLFVTN